MEVDKLIRSHTRSNTPALAWEISFICPADMADKLIESDLDAQINAVKSIFTKYGIRPDIMDIGFKMYSQPTDSMKSKITVRYFQKY